MARHLQPAWLVAFLTALLLLPSLADAQSRRRPPARYLGINQPDQAEGARILGDMRDLSLGGVWPYQEFDLRILPRKAPERRLSGRILGRRTASGPVLRIELANATGGSEILLVRGGKEAAVWRLEEAAGAVSISGADAMRPLAGTNLSAVDLQMPFMYWEDFVYEGREESAGRPAFVFLLYPPNAEADNFPGIGGVRVFIDTQFHAPTRIQWVDDAGEPLRTISVISLMRVNDHHGVKSFDVRDERTRDKTRLVFTAVAWDAVVPEELFSPAGPAGPARLQIPPEQLKSVR